MMSAPGEAETGDTTWGRGTRRKRFAGYIRAANELRQSYQKSYAEHARRRDEEPDELGIPGSFPEVHVARGGHEEMILFPSYARRHTKKSKSLKSYPPVSGKEAGSGDAEYWRREWQEYEDSNAVVDVDVRGWIYAPHRGTLNRKNRLMLGIARQLSGIPAPTSGSEADDEPHHKSDKLVGKIAEEEAQQIAEHGEREARFARSGGYGQESSLSERESSAPSSRYPSPRPGDFPHPGTSTSLQEGPTQIDPIKKRQSWNQPSNMSREELNIANAHLLKRLQPFFATASANVPLTIFYFNDETSQSRTTITNDSGQFNFRAALNFIPTQVRVLASEYLSASADVLITEPKGISLVSDIDDTVKHSAILGGAKEIFRNAFIREFRDLTVPGVCEWYTKLHDMGVKLHYLSNSPWQMYPLLVSFFAQAGLPPGSFHLKQYSGMLQGIFEPVAERKKGTMNRIMNDFPERRFIMVGDSGEADLELYVETALQYPGRILAIYIRDVSTSPSKISYEGTGQLFSGSRSSSPATASPRNSGSPYSMSPKVTPSTKGPTSAADEEDLIDLSEDCPSESPNYLLHTTSNSTEISRKTAPPLPAKPARLRSSSSTKTPTLGATSPPPVSPPLKSAPSTTTGHPRSPPRPRERPPVPLKRSSTVTYRLKPSQDIARYRPSPSRDSSLDRAGYRSTVRKKVGDVYNLLPSPAAYLNGSRSRPVSPVRGSNGDRGLGTTGDGTADKVPKSAGARPAPPLPPRRAISSYPAAAAQYASNKLWSSGNGDAGAVGGTGGAGAGTLAPPISGNRKEDMWRRRLARARAMLQGSGVVLRVWRTGEDLMDESVALVRKAQMSD